MVSFLFSNMLCRFHWYQASPYLSKLVNMIPRQKAINIGFTHFCDCRQSGKIVVAFVIVVSIKPRRYTYRKNQDDYSYNR